MEEKFLNMKNLSNFNVTDSYSYNWRIAILDIADDQVYINQRGIMIN